jgi:hypothetical protein
VRPWFDHALIALLALAVGLSFGLSYGLETRTSYLLHPLREINPTFLQFDWLATHTELVHKSFALINRALSTLGPLPWTVAIANVVLVTTFILAIYGFFHANFKRDALVAIALFMFFVVIDRTTSVADTHILTVRLEPSSIAACGHDRAFVDSSGQLRDLSLPARWRPAATRDTGVARTSEPDGSTPRSAFVKKQSTAKGGRVPPEREIPSAVDSHVLVHGEKLYSIVMQL